MNKKLARIIDIIYWGIILYNTFSGLVKGLKEGGINFGIEAILQNGFTTSEIFMTLFSILGLLVILFFFALLSNLMLTALYIGIKIATRKAKKDKFDKIDFKSDNYFKDKVPEYTPAVLSYIDDFSLDKKDVVATLLSLQLKKKIKINSSIEIIDNTCDNLTENEKYIFDKLKNKELKNLDMSEYTYIVLKEACKQELIQEKHTYKRKINKMFWMSIAMIVLIGIIVFGFLGSFAMNTDNHMAVFWLAIAMFVLICCAIIIPGTIIVYVSSYSVLKTADPYIRSKRGKELNERLEGLKNYLKDFSMLEERKQEDLMLWEEFLIYSVIFGINEKIVTEVYDKLN